MKELKVGDVRQVGDEVRHVNVAGIEEIDFDCRHIVNELERAGEWEFVQLLGHKILASDLMVAEFRRP